MTFSQSDNYCQDQRSLGTHSGHPKISVLTLQNRFQHKIVVRLDDHPVVDGFSFRLKFRLHHSGIITMKLIDRQPLSRQIRDRLATICCACLVIIPATVQTAFAQAAPEIAIDRAFRYDSSSLGSYGQVTATAGLKQWLGAYQRTLRDGDNYTVVFDRAALSLIVELKDSGELKSFAIGCPTNRSLSLSDAPEQLRRTLSMCGRPKL
jgi:hypothetical protein